MHNYYKHLVIIERLKNHCVKNKVDIYENVYVKNNLKVGSILTLKIFPKTISITANTIPTTEPNSYYIDDENELLYQITGLGEKILANGNYYIAISDNSDYVEKAYIVENGELDEIITYFDGTNSKLFINLDEVIDNGAIIITDDFKLYIRVHNIWITH